MKKRRTHKAVKDHSDYTQYNYVLCMPSFELKELENIEWSFHWDDVTCARCSKKGRPNEDDRS